MTIGTQPLTGVMGQVAAALHAASGFDEPWNAAAFTDLLATGANGRLAMVDDLPAGLILWRAAADEAEILTICTVPEHRKRGAGRRLLNDAVEIIAGLGGKRLFLEVAVDNAPAIALYRSFGFAEIGRRRGYYRTSDGATDALLLALAL